MHIDATRDGPQGGDVRRVIILRETFPLAAALWILSQRRQIVAGRKIRLESAPRGCIGLVASRHPRGLDDAGALVRVPLGTRNAE